MTQADLTNIAALDITGARGPADWIEWNLRNYVEHGFGLWVVETHAGEFIGDCGLTVQTVENEHLVEIGWHVLSSARSRGYATEAAGSARDFARERGVDHLIAIIRPNNVASQRVATKIGMTLEREAHKNGGPALIFGAGLSQ